MNPEEEQRPLLILSVIVASATRAASDIQRVIGSSRVADLKETGDPSSTRNLISEVREFSTCSYRFESGGDRRACWKEAMHFLAEIEAVFRENDDFLIRVYTTIEASQEINLAISREDVALLHAVRGEVWTTIVPANT